MALKRTRMPFYGKRETRLTELATKIAREGNYDVAARVYAAIEDGLHRKRKAHARIHH